MDLKEAIDYLKSKKIVVKEHENNYLITNAQNVSLKATETAIINYALNLKNPPKVTSLVEQATKTFWK